MAYVTTTVSPMAASCNAQGLFGGYTTWYSACGGGSTTTSEGVAATCGCCDGRARAVGALDSVRRRRGGTGGAAAALAGTAELAELSPVLGSTRCAVGISLPAAAAPSWRRDQPSTIAPTRRYSSKDSRTSMGSAITTSAWVRCTWHTGSSRHATSTLHDTGVRTCNVLATNMLSASVLSVSGESNEGTAGGWPAGEAEVPPPGL